MVDSYCYRSTVLCAAVWQVVCAAFQIYPCTTTSGSRSAGGRASFLKFHRSCMKIIPLTAVYVFNRIWLFQQHKQSRCSAVQQRLCASLILFVITAHPGAPANKRAHNHKNLNYSRPSEIQTSLIVVMLEMKANNPSLGFKMSTTDRLNPMTSKLRPTLWSNTPGSKIWKEMFSLLTSLTRSC